MVLKIIVLIKKSNDAIIAITIFFIFIINRTSLTVRFGNTLNLILLLNSIRIGRSTGSIDQLLSKALSHGLEVSETSLSCSGSKEVKSIVNSAERGHINSLSPDNSSSSNTGGILTGSRVDNSIDNDLNGVLIGEEEDDFKCMLNDAGSHDFLSGVTSLLHEATCKTFDDGAGCLTETLHLVTSSGMGKVGCMVSLACDVIL